VRLGTTLQGREILAVKITEDADRVRDGRRPAVLYSSAQHAREWISSEVNRRLMFWYLNEYRGDNREIRRLLDDTERLRAGHGSGRRGRGLVRGPAAWRRR
jgi:hypothetical protein